MLEGPIIKEIIAVILISFLFFSRSLWSMSFTNLHYNFKKSMGKNNKVITLLKIYFVPIFPLAGFLISTTGIEVS